MNRIVLLGLVILAAFADSRRAELCPPDQWQGFTLYRSLRLSPFHFYEEMEMQIFSDAINLKMASFVNLISYGSVRARFFLVLLYNKSGKGLTTYTLNLENNICQKVVDLWHTFDKQCLSAEAKNLGSWVVGVTGHGSMDVTSYAVREGGTKKVMTVTNVGSNFIPIHMSSFDSTRFTFSDFFHYNYTIGIQDPAIFDIPEQCLEGVVEEHPAHTPLVENLLRRFPLSKLF